MLAVSYVSLGQTGTKPDGSPCDTASECKGGSCIGHGCGPGEGICYTRPPPSRSDSGVFETARLPVQYCGCDGTTFITAAGFTPVKRYAYKGACKAAGALKPNGSPCDTAGECAGGICSGPGCGPGQGRCSSPPPPGTMVTQQISQYCGCDGKTFMAGEPLTKRYAYKGACKEPTPGETPPEKSPVAVPLYRRWWFWPTVAGTVVVLGAGGYFVGRRKR